MGMNNSIQHTNVNLEYDTVLQSLALNPDRKFIAVEMAFFERWLQQATDDQLDLVRQVVARGQLEFTNGGYCMHDEVGALPLLRAADTLARRSCGDASNSSTSPIFAGRPLLRRYDRQYVRAGERGKGPAQARCATLPRDVASRGLLPPPLAATSVTASYRASSASALCRVRRGRSTHL